MLSDLSIAYLFFGGSGAGCALVYSIVAIRSESALLTQVMHERFRSQIGRIWSKFIAMGLSVAILSIFLGAICLLVDLGQPLRLFALLFSSSPSLITFGSWAIFLCLLFCLFGMLLWLGTIPARPAFLKTTMGILAFICIAVMVYTGLLLANLPAVPLWNSAWLVALFFLSSLSCGIALANVSAVISRAVSDFGSVIRRFAVVDIITIILELISLVMLMCGIGMDPNWSPDGLTQTALAAFDSFSLLIWGDMAGLFWIGIVGIGLVVPLALNATTLYISSGSAYPATSISRMYIMLASSLTVLSGGAVLRYVFAIAAFHPMLLP